MSSGFESVSIPVEYAVNTRSELVNKQFRELLMRLAKVSGGVGLTTLAAAGLTGALNRPSLSLRRRTGAVQSVPVTIFDESPEDKAYRKAAFLAPLIDQTATSTQDLLKGRAAQHWSQLPWAPAAVTGIVGAPVLLALALSQNLAKKHRKNLLQQQVAAESAEYEQDLREINKMAVTLEQRIDTVYDEAIALAQEKALQKCAADPPAQAPVSPGGAASAALGAYGIPLSMLGVLSLALGYNHARSGNKKKWQRDAARNRLSRQLLSQPLTVVPDYVA